jgi:mannosyltransferase OCH1-like enzyme
MSPGIPKRIIQIWGAGEANMPLAEKASAVSVRRLNPEFEYMFFDDRRIEACIREYFPDYRGVFDSFRVPIQKYDLFRYLAIFRWGGFYFDVDVFLVSGLDGLLQFDCVFPFEELTLYRFLRRAYGMDWEVGNFGFGAVAGHPFIGEVLANCVKAQKDPDLPQGLSGFLHIGSGACFEDVGRISPG